MTSVAKDFHRFMKRVGKLTDGQVTLLDIDWDEGILQRFHVVLQPNSGLYKNGKFKFEIKLVDEYPETPPVVWCHTDIYHPNIDPTEDCNFDSSTNVCLNLLENGVWNKSYGLEGTVLGLLFLMHNPNLQDPLSPYFEGCDDEEYFEENVRKYMAGEEFDDMSFNTGFCVKDGILIEDIKPGESEMENKDVTTASSDVNDLKIEENDNVTETSCTDNVENIKTCTVVDNENDTETEANNKGELYGATQDKNNAGLKDVEHVKCDENAANTSGFETDNDKCSADITASLIDCENDEDSSDQEIELVNIDGEFVLFVHNSDNTDINQPEDRNVEEASNSDFKELTDTNSTDQDRMNTSDNTEENCEKDNFCNTRINSNENVTDEEIKVNLIPHASESKGLCDTIINSNENINVIDEESKINLIPHASELQSPADEIGEDGDSGTFSSQSKCHCGPWSTVTSAIIKIVHTIVQHKLYRDIGI